MGILKITRNGREIKEECGQFDLFLITRKLLTLNAYKLPSKTKSKMMESLSVNSTEKTQLMDALLVESSYPQNIEIIFKDLNRTFFFPSNNRNCTDLITAWTHDLQYTAYAQGDMDGRPHSVLNDYILFNPQFYEEHSNCDEKKEDHLAFYKKIQNTSFAYFDDNNSPCGISISYSPDNLSLWTVTIARHTTSNIEKKIITLFAPEQLIYRHNNKHKRLNNDSNLDLLTSTLNSIELSDKLLGLIQENNCINVKNLDEINQHLIHLTKAVEPVKKKFDKIYRVFHNEIMEILGNNSDKHPIVEVNKCFKKFLISSITTADTVNKVNELSTWLTNFTDLEYNKLRVENPKIQNLYMDRLIKQSFFERNQKNIVWGIIGLITFIILVNSVLTPLGIVLGVNLIICLLIAVAIFTITIANVIMISIREYQLSNYNQQTSKNLQIDKDYKQTTNQIEILTLNKIDQLNTKPTDTYDAIDDKPSINLEIKASNKSSSLRFFKNADHFSEPEDSAEIDYRQTI